jgi:hypothetical protein
MSNELVIYMRLGREAYWWNKPYSVSSRDSSDTVHGKRVAGLGLVKSSVARRLGTRMATYDTIAD